MTRETVVSLLGGLVLCGALSTSVSGQIDSREVSANTGKYVGPNFCISCHNEGLDDDKPPQDFCLLIESDKWKLDQHRRAYESLKPDNRIAKRMKDILCKNQLWASRGEGGKFTDFTSERRCLSCHANMPPDNIPQEFHNFKERGVSCESCHGPGGGYEGQHYQYIEQWRKKTPEDKAKLGMVNIRNPIDRAEQCYSCHIGNVAQRKVLTHEMYAAGHPPLPSIEMETFVDRMPRHWRVLREKGDFEFRKDYVAVTYPGVSNVDEEYPRFKGVVLGSVVARREMVQLIADQAKEAANGQSSWPEFALFDCTGCHHDLKSSSWRQEGYATPTRPGRPSLPQWPSALFPLAILQLSPENDNKRRQQEIDSSHASLVEAIEQRPFGDRHAIIMASERLIPLLDQLADDLMETTFDRTAAAQAICELIPRTGSDIRLIDFHSARQIAWALKVLVREQQTQYPDFRPVPLLDASMTPVARALLIGKSNLEDLRDWEMKVRQRVTEIEDAFSADQVSLNETLKLNSWRPEYLENHSVTASSRTAPLPSATGTEYEQTLGDWLSRMADYDAKTLPEKLINLFSALRQLPRPGHAE
jgi:hypothetical protein